ncbi:MAG: hypothetical protein ACREPN_05520 [Rudaea sp.]
MPNSPPPAAAARRRSGIFSTLASIILGGLAAGALWCLLALSVDFSSGFLILPLAIGLAFFMRWQHYRGYHGAFCAVLATLLAFVYAQYLFAAVRIAQMLGFALRDTLFKMGFCLAWQVARTNLGAWDIGWLVLACVASAWMMHRHPSGAG